MMQRWTEDWRHFGRRAQIALVFLAILTVMLSVAGAVDNLLHRNYVEALCFPGSIAIVGLRFVIWPFFLASSVRRRRGRVHLWLTWTLILGFLIPGIAYFAWRTDHPILAESEQVSSSSSSSPTP
jgi:hypothetical protein